MLFSDPGALINYQAFINFNYIARTNEIILVLCIIIITVCCKMKKMKSADNLYGCDIIA